MRTSIFWLALSAAALVSAKVPRVGKPGSKQAQRASAKRPSGSRDASSFTGTGWQAQAPSASAPKSNVWAQLTDDEAADIVKYLHKQTELNLTASSDAGTWDNAITVVDILRPNKTGVLAYLDGEGSAPDRYGRAVIYFGATEQPWVQEFQVGPLPISHNSSYFSLDWASTKGAAVQRNFDADEDLSYDFMVNVSISVQDIIQDLLNGTVTGSDDDDFDIWGIDPLWHPTPDTTVHWVTYWAFPSGDNAIFDGETLLPQGLFFEMNSTGRDPSQWSVIGWLWANTYYNSTEAFRAAWEAGELPKLEANLQGSWIGTDYQGPDTPLGANSSMFRDKVPPPVTVPVGGEEGLRYKVDVEDQYVEWMDFSFYVTFSRDSGLRLFDIKYRGERIVYELGLEEAIAHYAGNDPAQSGTAYLDTFYGFGPYAFELLAGYDCPTYATFLNTSFHADEVSKTHPNSICMFEQDLGYLIQRHSNDAYLASTRNIAFTVRSVSTVGNYDYNFDYAFHLDGTIEVTVRASGYIQSAYYYGNEDYGYKIKDGLSGSMHDHSLLFKADIDILGTSNSIANHTIYPVSESYPWSHGATRNTMKLARSYIESEDEGKINWAPNAQTMLMVVNADERNAFGEDRGYRIMPGVGGGMYLTIQNSSNLLNSQSFATHNLYATVQHDTEPRATHALNDYDTANPIVDFSTYFDGESLNQTDIVLWFNLGMHHVPHTGDLPNTVFSTAQGSMLIVPHNYLLHDPSRDSRQTVRVNYNSSGVQSVKTFGADAAKGGANLTATVPDFWTYRGDIAVRKFPYDPLHPYNDTESIV
ncbi:copper amine oxidase [Peniophora sp. CONT]|nr:copper amine oxidase [Peniophora sp. CONT]